MIDQILVQAEILGPALLAGLLVLATHVPLGREVLRRGIIFLDLAIAQIAAFGVVLGGRFWLDDHATQSLLARNLIAVGAAIAGATLLYRLRHVEIRVQEAVIGILFILAATGSVMLLATDPHGGEHLKEILVGQILWIQASDLIPVAVIYALVLGTWYGLRDKFGGFLFYPLFALTITLSTQLVGVYLVFASLIIPSLATLHREHGGLHAFLLGTGGYGAGLLASASLDLPAGATIAWSLALVALVYFIMRRMLAHARALR